jgi:NADPH-dependent 2,4-dienoyl-CoA reductase/sulfur reductase-like enzyme
MAELRVIVVGAGPAGIRAAETLAEAGLRPVVIEEGTRDGGQIYRRQPENFTRPYRKLYGSEATRAAALHGAFDRLRDRIDYRPRTLAWNIVGRELHVVAGGRAEALAFDALVIATGATDRLMPVRGWDFSGTYSLGAAQIALKAQACAIGRRVVFAGTGPLLYLVAAQYARAGAGVAAILDTSPFTLRLKALPQLAARPKILAKGLALVADLRRRRIPVATGVTLAKITGSAEQGVSGIVYRESGGAKRRIAADAVALGWHLRPESQLADLAGCAFRFEPDTRQFLPQIDAEGRSSVPGVYLAGDGARLLGADGAEAAGRLAALALLADLGRPADAAAQQKLRATLARMDRFRRGLAAAFPWPATAAADLTDDTVVCRCEVITAAELRHAVTARGAPEVNRAKAFSRVGMGRCQGRYCGHAAAEIVAAATGAPLADAGRLRGHAPVKPLSIATVNTVEAAP